MKDSELLVTWRHPSLERTYPVGWLTYDGRTYRFEYTDGVRQIPDFRPLAGFPNMDVASTSAQLFPLFTLRIMSPKRVDFPRWVAKLGLTVESTPWEQLVASRGARHGDAIEVVALDRSSL